jgi:hypothetical protein
LIAVIGTGAAVASVAAAAGPTITVMPPPGAHVDTTDVPPQYFRTADTQPTLGIEADAGSQFRCDLDNSPDWGPCGPPLPGCTATVCASYRPASPLTGVKAESEHMVGIELFDASGHQLASTLQPFTVDTTPPTISLGIAPGSPTLRPRFDVGLGDDEYGDPRLATDSADCSLTPVGAPPVWRSCVAPNADGGSFSEQLPHRHIDYRAQVRATDDVGHTATKYLDFDPVPCGMRAGKPANLGRVISSGFAVRLQCSFTRIANLLIYPISVNGRRFASSPGAAVANRPLIGSMTVRGHQPHWSFRGHVHLFRDTAAETKRFTSVKFLVLACPSSDCESLDPSWDYTQFTIRR